MTIELIVFQTGLSGWIFSFSDFCFFGEKKLSRNSVWNNHRLIGACLYSLVLARGLFLKGFPSLDESELHFANWLKGRSLLQPGRILHSNWFTDHNHDYDTMHLKLICCCAFICYPSFAIHKFGYYQWSFDSVLCMQQCIAMCQP